MKKGITQRQSSKKRTKKKKSSNLTEDFENLSIKGKPVQIIDVVSFHDVLTTIIDFSAILDPENIEQPSKKLIEKCRFAICLDPMMFFFELQKYVTKKEFNNHSQTTEVLTQAINVIHFIRFKIVPCFTEAPEELSLRLDDLLCQKVFEMVTHLLQQNDANTALIAKYHHLLEREPFLTVIMDLTKEKSKNNEEDLKYFLHFISTKIQLVRIYINNAEDSAALNTIYEAKMLLAFLSDNVTVGNKELKDKIFSKKIDTLRQEINIILKQIKASSEIDNSIALIYKDVSNRFEQYKRSLQQKNKKTNLASHAPSKLEYFRVKINQLHNSIHVIEDAKVNKKPFSIVKKQLNQSLNSLTLIIQNNEPEYLVLILPLIKENMSSWGKYFSEFEKASIYRELLVKLFQNISSHLFETEQNLIQSTPFLRFYQAGCKTYPLDFKKESTCLLKKYGDLLATEGLDIIFEKMLDFFRITEVFESELAKHHCKDHQNLKMYELKDCSIKNFSSVNLLVGKGSGQINALFFFLNLYTLVKTENNALRQEIIQILWSKVSVFFNATYHMFSKKQLPLGNYNHYFAELLSCEYIISCLELEFFLLLKESLETEQSRTDLKPTNFQPRMQLFESYKFIIHFYLKMAVLTSAYGKESESSQHLIKVDSYSDQILELNKGSNEETIKEIEIAKDEVASILADHLINKDSLTSLLRLLTLTSRFESELSIEILENKDSDTNPDEEIYSQLSRNFLDIQELPYTASDSVISYMTIYYHLQKTLTIFSKLKSVQDPIKKNDCLIFSQQIMIIWRKFFNNATQPDLTCTIISYQIIEKFDDIIRLIAKKEFEFSQLFPHTEKNDPSPSSSDSSVTSKSKIKKNRFRELAKSAIQLSTSLPTPVEEKRENNKPQLPRTLKSDETETFTLTYFGSYKAEKEHKLLNHQKRKNPKRKNLPTKEEVGISARQLKRNAIQAIKEKEEKKKEEKKRLQQEKKEKWQKKRLEKLKNKLEAQRDNKLDAPINSFSEESKKESTTYDQDYVICKISTLTISDEEKEIPSASNKPELGSQELDTLENSSIEAIDQKFILPYRIQYPSSICYVFEAFTIAGFIIVIRGGYIRDFIIGDRNPNDIDFITNCPKELVASLLKGAINCPFPGKENLFQWGSYVDIYCYPDLSPQKLQDIAFTADLSINSLFGDHLGRIIDFRGIFSHFKSQYVYCFGNISERIRHDPNLILRFIRHSNHVNKKIQGNDLIIMKELATLITQKCPLGVYLKSINDLFSRRIGYKNFLSLLHNNFLHPLLLTSRLGLRMIPSFFNFCKEVIIEIDQIGTNSLEKYDIAYKIIALLLLSKVFHAESLETFSGLSAQENFENQINVFLQDYQGEFSEYDKTRFFNGVFPRMCMYYDNYCYYFNTINQNNQQFTPYYSKEKHSRNQNIAPPSYGSKVKLTNNFYN